MSRPEDFRSARRSRRFHGWLQGLLALTLFLGVNHLLRNHPVLFDLTRSARHTLAAETLAAVAQIDQPVTLVSTLREDDESPEVARAAREVRELGERLATASEGSKARITFRQVDPFRQRRESEQLGAVETNSVVVQSGRATRSLFLDELYETKELQRTAFRGEQVFLSAILEVTSDRRPVLYFLEGHGEASIRNLDPREGLSELAEFLRLRNFDLRPLDITVTGGVPADAAMVLVLGPTSPLLAASQEVLRTYLNRRSGKVVVMLRPGTPHGLDDLLWDWGVLSDDVLIVDSSNAFTSQTGDLVVRRLGEHAITRPLIDNELPVLFGLARPVREDPGRAEDPGLSVSTLLQTPETAWGERDFRGAQRIAKDARDIPGPLGLAVVSERKAASQAGIDLAGGKLVVFGTGDFITNGKIAQLGNWRMFLNTVNWTLARDGALAVAPRPIERLQLALSADEQRHLSIWVLGVIPGIVALIGVCVHLVRRS